ncbi:MAG: response regulator transcription factor [Candidatus Promineifilaceae bacterium]
MSNDIRILLVDDHFVVRQGLRALLETRPGFNVIGEASDGLEAVQAAKKLKPDIILIDLVMPNMDGIAAIKEITADNPKARILVLTSFAEDDKVFAAIKAGALGYLLKDSSPQELLQAIKAVYRGESSLHPTIALKLVRELHQPPDPITQDAQSLTARETAVLKLLAQGFSNQDISQSMNISERTVATHVSNILSKLHVANRTQAALYALREGLASLDDTTLPNNLPD